MPELPEVETIVRQLREKIIGLKITDFWADWPRSVRQAGGIDGARKQMKGRKILKVNRRAKYIVVDIEGPKTIFVHQKISGHLLYGKWAKNEQGWTSRIKGPLSEDSANKYIRMVFYLNNGYQVALSDPRRFGKMILVDDRELKNLKEIQELGPEPLEISLSDFSKLFKNKKGKIKQILMDPKFIAGIGNIYSDEILWQIGVHPLSKPENLKTAQIKSMYSAMQGILNKAIKYKGDSMDDFRTLTGEKGEYQEMHKAYQRTGDKCDKKDGGIIKRIKVGGRSAHFCSKHQKSK
ncbi:MAG: Formamidopyrimidine-DNA glycosylase [Candidatus Yanofskybacteria bacterium GW2011_GWF1_44_227]|uniref:Formamidopyrimidine-DNA glycosylase n=1 Tax=Candidatus Yanofskybacteria bacterium GW2011_GWE2_40_11 TaxID=1619033 RepID=A0A0G0QRL6_9BACT|nr:MAG: Formamidopyrimidine-DNA glycosylase [Candidatus Yanofskybacteria bacterium GW2011_GWE1_40_10]KKR40006.1 MAG: Formamidopyrimidine-DNA glycosylase [Candidatus Yanofskybacteria bacterium GW2011_GWE2_40_11]KKT15375.1 MAG: Formamidopyrimidine-DNA glycosylase [Candidatus Yanofskybacteria bacterium GW2011_GWF2_43_596]KKT53059.1 MAG: Formamidopyrimidine-DNA glycosylase [Candidatus Yanofskybacteria bacterium GW2011_GWF1_44_227]OGN35740.1 MAG: DNA-formamidopyrimidine glycosylase [Candidatus Yanof